MSRSLSSLSAYSSLADDSGDIGNNPAAFASLHNITAATDNVAAGDSSSSSSSSSSTSILHSLQQQQQPSLLTPLIPQPASVVNIVPKIQNLVCSINLGLPVDPKTIAMRARNAEYNPKRFAACIMRLREPKSTALVFRTGKLICAGCRSIPAAVQACHLYTRILQRIQYPLASASQFTVINLVATINLRFPIRLESLAAEHEESCSYEPELFPGLVYRLEDPKCVVLVFVSGKCVVTGAKGMEDVRRAVELIYPLLRLYRKQHTSTSTSSSVPYAAAPEQQPDGSGSSVDK